MNNFPIQEEKVREVYILIGPSGSGKSTWSRAFVAKFDESFNIGICSADNYFIDPETGIYKFDGRKLPAAHKACQSQFHQFLSNEYDIVIVDNTNLRAKDRQVYIDTAESLGYTICFVKFHTRYDNVHGVPKEKVSEMSDLFESDECNTEQLYNRYTTSTIDVKDGLDWLRPHWKIRSDNENHSL